MCRFNTCVLRFKRNCAYLKPNQRSNVLPSNGENVRIIRIITSLVITSFAREITVLIQKM